ncbi:MAG TPA: ABC transporter permease [Gemmataceae bacterium]|nr:ABC transporter permease [Gemmataceae bacterium]
MSILVKILLILVVGFGGLIAVAVALMLLLGCGLTLVLLLQFLGVLRRIPLGYNLRNLFVRWPTTLLTALAFTVVVSLLVMMLAFVNGLFELTQASGQTVNVLVLSDGATEESVSSLGYGDITTLNQYPAIVKDEKGEPLISWEVYLVVNQPIQNAKPGGQQRRFLQVRGLMDPARTGRVHNIALHPGGAWFTQAGVQPLPGSTTGEQAVQVVLGEGIARVLGTDQGKPSLEVGDVFPMAERQWIVVGILQSSGSTFDSEIWAKQQIVGEKFGKPSYSTVVLRTADTDAARRAAQDLSDNFKPAVAAQVETAYYEKLNGTNQSFLYAALAVASVMALGGVLGVMNTMFAAISQRQKDIGVLRILGYARWQILESFFLESLLLALIGGAIGCLLGWMVDGWSASSIISSGSGGGGRSVVFKLVVDSKILLGGLAFSLLMGNIGGLLPALSAMRVRPLESLR